MPLALLALPNAGAQPIRLHPKNSHYFLYRARATALVGSGEHYGSVINAAFDYKKYLAALASEGLNYTRVFTGSYVEAPGKSFGIRRNTLAPDPGRFIAPWARSTTPGYAGGGNKFDLNQWNGEYFERLHDFLGEASRRGIIVELTLFTSQYGDAQWKLSPFNPANNVNGIDAIDWKVLNTTGNGNIQSYQERYARKLVDEANAYDNVIFEIQNEPWSDRGVLADVLNPYLAPPGRDRYPNSIDLADSASLTWQSNVARWITSEEATLANKHLIAQNCCNFGFPVSDLVPGVSVINFHYAFASAVDWNIGLNLALACDETGFHGQDDDFYLREAWNFMLSGGSVFDNLDYSFTPGLEDGSDTEPNGPGGGSPALRRELAILSRFLHSLPLADLRPDISTVKHASGAYARALSIPGREYGIYVQGSAASALTLDLPAGNYSVEWIDIHSGSIGTLDHFRHSGGRRTIYTPPQHPQVALHLIRTAD